MQKLVCPKGGAAFLTFSPDGDWLAGLGPVGAPAALYCWTRSRDWAITGIPKIGEVTGLAFHPGGRTLAYAAIVHPMWRALAPVPPPPPPGAAPPSIWRRRFAKNAADTRPFTGVHFYPLDAINEFVPNRVGVPQPEDAAPNTVLTRERWARGLTFTPDGRWLLAGQARAAGFGRSVANVYHWHFTETDGVWQATNTLAEFGATERGGALIGGYLALAGWWGVAAAAIESPGGLFVPDVRAATAVAVAPRDELIATGERGSVFVWSLRAAAPVASIAVDGPATALCFSPDGRTLAVGHAGAVGFWDTRTGAPGPVRDYGVDLVAALAYAPDGLTLAVAGRKGVVVVDTE